MLVNGLKQQLSVGSLVAGRLLIHPLLKQRRQIAGAVLLGQLFEVGAGDNAPTMGLVVVPQKGSKHFLAHRLGQGFQKKRPAAINNSAIAAVIVVPHRQARSEYPLDLPAASASPVIRENLLTALAIDILVIQQGEHIGPGLRPATAHPPDRCQPYCRTTDEPPRGRPRLQERAGGRASDFPSRVIQANQNSDDARILDAQGKCGCADQVKLGKGIETKTLR